MVADLADYALLGDGHGAALVTRDGSVDWWCAPRFDSRASFARLLDPAAGHWSIRPRGAFTARRRYVPGTMVLETELITAGGRARLTEALALGTSERGHDVGASSPHALVRLVTGLEGTVDLAVELAPRLEFGLVTPGWQRTGDGALQTVGGPDVLTLHTGAELVVAGGTAHATLPVAAGEQVGFTLTHHPGVLAPAHVWPPPPAEDALAETVAGWRSWSELHQRYTGAYAEQVRRSALVLRALTYVPTGAIVAAPTTSLPEVVGGEANWDYRFAWLRDASFTLRALYVGACPEEARQYVTFMARAAAGPADRPVPIMVGVDGERDLTEHTLEHLAGWRASRPVRVGNDAWTQRQHDVPGDVLDAVWLLRDQITQLDDTTTAFLCALADRAARDWRVPDAGIWEARGSGRHHLSAKLLCWVALDRAVRLADRLGPGARPEAWARERDAVRAAILGDGVDPATGAFTVAFGASDLDASALLISIVGFLPPDDARVRATVERIAAELTDDALVRRWTGTREGGFFLACYWLVEALALDGQADRARAHFERVTSWANDLGLLSEVVDPSAGGLVGNFPQAFSHIGLINAAWAIDQAERR